MRDERLSTTFAGCRRQRRSPTSFRSVHLTLRTSISRPSRERVCVRETRAGHEVRAPNSIELDLSKSLGRILHVDDEERYEVWRSWLSRETPPPRVAPGSREGRLRLMLFAALGFRRRPIEQVDEALALVWQSQVVREEIVELLDVLRDRVRLESRPIDPLGVVPIHSHATYGLYEIISAYGLTSEGVLRESREGLAWAERHQTDLLFVTLNKSDEDYSPTTRYQDYPISPTLFHWETQSRTTLGSTTGQRYVNHVARASKVVLFVRENKQDDRGVSNPYLCLGPARHVSHESEKPIRIVWELERPMPAEIFQHAKVAAG